MKEEMININANLLDEPSFTSFERDSERVEAVNFTLVKKYGKGKEYINCSAYGDKVEKARDFQKGDLIHVFGYFKEREKEGKKYKKTRLKRRKKTRRNKYGFFCSGSQCITDFGYGSRRRTWSMGSH